jgi:hypothetical protein
MSAGIVFKSETHVLMGYQPDKNSISGIGGKPMGHETPIETALRETVEEMFGLHPKKKLMDILLTVFTGREPVKNGSYTMFLCSMTDLDLFMMSVKDHSDGSPYYKKFPKTLDDLLFERRTPLGVEVSHLCMVPIIHEPFLVDQRDMKYIA